MRVPLDDRMKKLALPLLIALCLCLGCNAVSRRSDDELVIHPKVFSLATCWLSDTEQPVATEINLDAVRADRNQFNYDAVSNENGWITFKDAEGSMQYRVLRQSGSCYTVKFLESGGGSFTKSTIIGYSLLRRTVLTDGTEKEISVLKVTSVR